MTYSNNKQLANINSLTISLKINSSKVNVCGVAAINSILEFQGTLSQFYSNFSILAFRVYSIFLI